MFRALLAATFLIYVNTALAGDAATLVVREAHGEVWAGGAGQEARAKVGDTFLPPVQFRTGADGAALIAQGDSTVRIAPSSLIAIPKGATASTIDKVMQQVGGALYNVKSRNGRPFSVETPYLTSVVKGTLFSITVQGSEATVALLEGSLEVSGRGADTVMLASGDTARLKRGGDRIAVERSREGRAPAGAGDRGAGAATAPNAPASAGDEVGSELGRVSAGLQSRATVAVTQPASVTPTTGSNGSPGAAPIAPVAPTDSGAAAPAGSPSPVPVTTPGSTAGGASTPTAPPATAAPVVTPPAVTAPVVTTPVVNTPAAPTPIVSTPVVPVDDGNNGHGNDADGVDSSNPGHRNKKKH